MARIEMKVDLDCDDADQIHEAILSLTNAKHVTDVNFIDEQDEEFYQEEYGEE